MSKKLKVYIASPYTNGNKAANVRRQLDAQKILLDTGFVPFTPLLSHFSEIHHSRSEAEWFAWDLEWLKACDILIRIRPTENGVELESTGSQIEEEKAVEWGLMTFPFNNLKELKQWAKSVNKDELCECIKV